MKFLHITLFSISCMFVHNAIGDDLFPELSNTIINEKIVEENIVPEEKIESDQTIPEKENPVVENTEEEDEDDEEDQQRKIILYIDNVDSTVTAVRAVSFCNMDFFIHNQLKKPIQSISGTFTLDGEMENFEFKSVDKDQITGLNYTYVGTVCAHLLEIPDVEIQTCKIEGMSEKKCKQLVEFVPMIQTPSMETM